MQSFVFHLTLLCFIKWHFFFKLSADNWLVETEIHFCDLPSKMSSSSSELARYWSVPFFYIYEHLILGPTLNRKRMFSSENQYERYHETRKGPLHTVSCQIPITYVTGTQRGNFIKIFKSCFLRSQIIFLHFEQVFRRAIGGLICSDFLAEYARGRKF